MRCLRPKRSRSSLVRSSVVILSGTAISEPEISANATVEGEIIQENLTGTLGSFGESDGLASAVFFAIALIAASLTVFLVFPSFSGSVAGRIRSTPIRTFALGIGMIVGVPIIIALLFASRIGWIVALGTLFGYFVLLLCAMLFGIVSVGKLGLELTKKDEAGRRPVHLLAIGLGVVLILLLAQIPVLGTIVLLLVLLQWTRRNQRRVLATVSAASVEHDSTEMIETVHPNMSVLAKLNLQDIDACRDVFSDHFIWHYFNPRLPELEGDHLGVQGLKNFFAKLSESTSSSFQQKLIDARPVGDELVITQVCNRMNLGGSTIEVDAVVIWRIVGRRIAEAWDIPAINTVRTIQEK